MSQEQIARVLNEAEDVLRAAPQGSPEWKVAFMTVGLARAALRADQIGDIRVVSDPQYDRNPEFNHPGNLAVYVGEKKINYLVDEPDIAILFGLAFKYLEQNDAPRFVAFAARMLGIESGYAELRKPELLAAPSGDNK